ncbi:uncharacterized protein FA14DRAFT_182279 [Meira miltonrushii]|uniref:Uncharacterized protein n=1 Tax=Meira miltonrushii TaxID=1280837 RepID=A0A316V4C2_9BASI|nr:uncharacterized protein FA14DRAFT_182279 [Meira miltonrushii]PWN32370.1 hypothetical protein FA14DRAFT_182279 [Meira miltonrushii]
MHFNVFAFLFAFSLVVAGFDVVLSIPAGPGSPSSSPTHSRSQSSASRTPAMQIAHNKAKDQAEQSVVSGVIAAGGTVHAVHGVGRAAMGALTLNRSKFGDGAIQVAEGGAAALCAGIVCGVQGVKAVRNYTLSKSDRAAAKKYSPERQQGHH